MNNLMTRSFLSYVDLKKQASRDSQLSEHETDIESGLTTAEQENLSVFFADMDPIQSKIASISDLLSDLTRLNSESKTTRTRNLLRGIRDQMDSNITSILRKAHSIKSSLAALDASNAENRARFGLNSPVDRNRTAITNGLRSKLRELMIGLSSLREDIAVEEEENQENMQANEVELKVSESTQVRHLRRSLKSLHQVFLDMAVVVEGQGEQLNDIEENVARAQEYVCGGTRGLAEAQKLMLEKRKTKRWLWCLGSVLAVLVVILLCLVFRFAED